MTLKEYNDLKEQEWSHTEYIKNINGDILKENTIYDIYNNDLLKNQILFDILQTLIEIKDELKTKDEK